MRPLSRSPSVWSRRRRKSVGHSWFGRLFIVPHFIVGLCLIGYSLLVLAWSIAGHNVTGVVRGASRRDLPKGGVSYVIDYRYATSAGTRQDSRSVPEWYYGSLPTPLRTAASAKGPEPADAPSITVRVFELGPIHHADAIVTPAEHWKQTGVFVLITLFWNVIVSVFVYREWVSPWLAGRALVRGQWVTRR